MPKKAVAIFFIAAFIGAALFVYFTFPRTKEEIPKSNNQPDRHSVPSPNPDGLPVPEPIPHPDAPKLPPGPKLRVMAWASGNEAKTLQAQIDAFTASSGRGVALTLDSNEAVYRKDLQEALASRTPPDLCLISSRDFCGINPVHDLAVVKPASEFVPRSLAAFTVDGQIKAVPAEFAVDLLYFNTAHFDRAGLGHPGRHWNWDILEAISRALSSLQLKDPAGQPIYPLELPATFDVWNLLSAESGRPVLDLNVWHLTDAGSQPYQVHALDFMRRLFVDLVVTAPQPKGGEAFGSLFAQQRSSLLIAPSNFASSFSQVPFQVTLVPGNLNRASLAWVNGWAISARSTESDAANELAVYLAAQPIHTGWSSPQKSAAKASFTSLCQESLDQAILPRIDARTAPLAQFLDQQMALLASGGAKKTDALYAQIQAESKSDLTAPAVESKPPEAAILKPTLLSPAGMPIRTGL